MKGLYGGLWIVVMGPSREGSPMTSADRHPRDVCGNSSAPVLSPPHGTAH
jgi:hypothetical protein